MIGLAQRGIIKKRTRQTEIKKSGISDRSPNDRQIADIFRRAVSIEIGHAKKRNKKRPDIAEDVPKKELVIDDKVQFGSQNRHNTPEARHAPFRMWQRRAAAPTIGTVAADLGEIKLGEMGSMMPGFKVMAASLSAARPKGK